MLPSDKSARDVGKKKKRGKSESKMIMNEPEN
jgi:hypothetical protein